MHYAVGQEVYGGHTICDIIEEENKFSVYIKKNKNIGLFNLYIKPTFKFLNSYILRRGFLDGKTGWIICKLRAHETWLKAKIALDYKNEK